MTNHGRMNRVKTLLYYILKGVVAPVAGLVCVWPNTVVPAPRPKLVPNADGVALAPNPADAFHNHTIDFIQCIVICLHAQEPQLSQYRDSCKCLLKAYLFTMNGSIQCNRGSMRMCYISQHFTC